jgi:hypothetical protein
MRLRLILELLPYVQAVLDHPVEQRREAVVFDDECWAKPLRVILEVSANPFTRPLSERPNERKRACGRIQMSVLRAARFIAYRLCLPSSSYSGNHKAKFLKISGRWCPFGGQEVQEELRKAKVTTALPSDPCDLVVTNRSLELKSPWGRVGLVSFFTWRVPTSYRSGYNVAGPR